MLLVKENWQNAIVVSLSQPDTSILLNSCLVILKEMPMAHFVIFRECQRVEGSGLQAQGIQRFEFRLVGSLTQVGVRVEVDIARFEVHADLAG
jgi:hypothetical protein